MIRIVTLSEFPPGRGGLSSSRRLHAAYGMGSELGGRRRDPQLRPRRRAVRLTTPSRPWRRWTTTSQLIYADDKILYRHFRAAHRARGAHGPGPGGRLRAVWGRQGDRHLARPGGQGRAARGRTCQAGRPSTSATSGTCTTATIPAARCTGWSPEVRRVSRGGRCASSAAEKEQREDQAWVYVRRSSPPGRDRRGSLLFDLTLLGFPGMRLRRTGRGSGQVWDGSRPRCPGRASNPGLMGRRQSRRSWTRAGKEGA